LKVRFLGTGTSFGIPVVGCDCAVCSSADVRDRRTRHGLLIEDEGRHLLVDTPPELRLQLLAAGVRHLDAVFLSHPHADHIHGIDDLRIFTLRSERPLPVYVSEEHASEVRRRFPYIWDTDAERAAGTTVPDLEMVVFRDRTPTQPAGLTLTPVGFPHGPYRSYGFRLGDLALIIDAKRVPPDAIELLEGVRVLVVNALWYGNPHPSHFNVEEALEVAERLAAEHTYLTHLTHRVEHARLAQRLPKGVEPAYDGLEIEL
jgi:phosphoribosyl 1,2-cyclic phosphate phosphodiesterase